MFKHLNDNKIKYAKMSDEIWDNPELKFNEHVSSQVLIKQLEREGFSIVKGVGKMETAFVASYGSGHPYIGYLGEYDALDGLSQVENSTEEKKREHFRTGHGCGHHLLGVGSLAAAVALKEYMKEHNIVGTVKYYGCPGEEGGSGKAFMAREGVFDNLDVAITWHPGSVNSMFSVGTLSNIQCYFRFKGKSSHAAVSPHLGRSALDSVELMNVGVNYLREHIIPDARVHYAVTNSGGSSPNVVQAEAEVLYLIRAPKISQALDILERVKNIAKGAALMSETDVEVIFDKACSNIIPNSILSEVMSDIGRKLEPIDFTDSERRYAKNYIETLSKQEQKSNLMTMKMVGLNDSKILQELQSELFTLFLPYVPTNKIMPGSSDVGDVSWIVPTVQCITACYANGTPAHSWQMVAQGKASIAHKGMIRASEIMFKTGVELLSNPNLIIKAKEELETKLAGETYSCPIPNSVDPNI